MIFLQADTVRLIERIRRRKRDYETEISEAYVEEVAKAYNYFFFNYTTTPLLVIDTNQIDYFGPHNQPDVKLATMARMAISLPLFPDMTDEQVDEVCGALKEILHP